MLTKLKIIETTYGLFAEKGLEFSLNEVAEKVGIKKASIYSHFKSKDDLLVKIFEEAIEEYFTEVEKTAVTLKDLFYGILNYYGSSKEKLLFWKRLLIFPPQQLDEDINKKIIELSDRRFDKVKKLIANELNEIDSESDKVESLAIGFLSIVHGLLSCEVIYRYREIGSSFNSEWLLIEKLMKKEA